MTTIQHENHTWAFDGGYLTVAVDNYAVASLEMFDKYTWKLHIVPQHHIKRAVFFLIAYDDVALLYEAANVIIRHSSAAGIALLLMTVYANQLLPGGTLISRF